MTRTHPLKIIQGDHGIDEPHIESVLGRVVGAKVPDLPRFLLAHDPRHVAGTVPCVKAG